MLLISHQSHALFSYTKLKPLVFLKGSYSLQFKYLPPSIKKVDLYVILFSLQNPRLLFSSS